MRLYQSSILYHVAVSNFQLVLDIVLINHSFRNHFSILQHSDKKSLLGTYYLLENFVAFIYIGLYICIGLYIYGLGWKGPYRSSSSNPPAMGRDTFH